MSVIEAKALRAGYGDGPDILGGIDLTVGPREIVTILGPNGCGKSTLLKTIAGFVRPRAGSVSFENEDVTRIPIHTKVRDHGVEFRPLRCHVFGTLTVEENISLGGRSLAPGEYRSRFDELMEAYPTLASKKKRRASALSGGERQILSLCRALVSRPRILLLDEPSAGLSPLMMHEVFDAIQGIRDRQGLAILMVEQNAFEALGIADRAYVLSLGEVALTAPAADLLADPAMKSLYLGA